MNWFYCSSVALLLSLTTLQASDKSTNSVSEPSPSPEAEQDTATSQQATDDCADLIVKGYAAEDKKDFTGAIEFYSKALKIDSESIVALLRRGICYAKIDKNLEASKDLWAAVKLQPKTLGDFEALSWLKSTCPLEIFRDGAVAVAYAEKALSISESAENYDILAAGYAEMGNFQQARQMIDRGIKYFPNSPQIPAMQEHLALYLKKKKYRENWSPDTKSK
jgi:tetratricopeptide (TPR) repeat protein